MGERNSYSLVPSMTVIPASAGIHGGGSPLHLPQPIYWITPNVGDQTYGREAVVRLLNPFILPLELAAEGRIPRQENTRMCPVSAKTPHWMMWLLGASSKRAVCFKAGDPGERII